MAKVLVSFIGTGNYQTSRYKYEDKICETHLFPIALNQFFPEADKLLVFLTDEAEKAKRKDDEKTYFRQLCEHRKANNLLPPQKIEIKSGKNDDELWEIFDTIASELNENDEIVFDITHAFRSLPLLSFLVIAFLRETKNVTLKAILYGAFEARYKDNGTEEDENAEDKNGIFITPVFDLSPFIELLDWISATKQFKTTGNASLLVNLLKENKFKKSITELSDALRLLRPVQIMKKADALSNDISNEENTKRIKTKPFLQLLESVEKSYSPLALKKPEENKKEFIAKLVKLARWYFDKGQYVQSIAIIRETVPTLVCHELNLDFFKRNGNRELAEKCLNRRDNEPMKPDSEDLDLCKDLSKDLTNLWRKITQLRNDVLHAGFNENQQKSSDIIPKNKNFLECLEKIVNENE